MNKRQRKKHLKNNSRKKFLFHVPKCIEEAIERIPRIHNMFNPITGERSQYLTYDQTMPDDFRSGPRENGINIQKHIYDLMHDHIRHYGKRPSKLLINREDLYELKSLMAHQCMSLSGNLETYEGLQVIETLSNPLEYYEQKTKEEVSI